MKIERNLKQYWTVYIFIEEAIWFFFILNILIYIVTDDGNSHSYRLDILIYTRKMVFKLVGNVYVDVEQWIIKKKKNWKSNIERCMFNNNDINVIDNNKKK